jgi:hypothetical protein
MVCGYCSTEQRCGELCSNCGKKVAGKGKIKVRKRATTPPPPPSVRLLVLISCPHRRGNGTHTHAITTNQDPTKMGRKDGKKFAGTCKTKSRKSERVGPKKG